MPRLYLGRAFIWMNVVTIMRLTKNKDEAVSGIGRSTKPTIAARLFITDIMFALIATAGAIFVASYGFENQSLLKEQVMLGTTEELLREHREAAFETHLAATAMRARWTASTSAQQSELISSLQTAATGFVQTGDNLMAHDPVVTLHEFDSGPAAIGQLSALAEELINANQPGKPYSARANLDNEFNGNHRFLIGILKDVEQIAMMNTASNQRQIAEGTSKLVRVIVLGVTALIIGLALRFILMMRWFVRPAHCLAKVTTQLANGDIEQTVPPMPVNELQKIADALTVFRDVTQEAHELRDRSHNAELKAKEASLELKNKERETRRLMDIEREKAIVEMAGKFESSVSSVVIATSAAAEELDLASEQLAHSVTAAGNQATEISAASTQANQSVQSVAAAIEELSSYVRNISGQVTEQSRLSQEAGENSKTSVSNAQVLTDKTSSIDDIANVIAAIAERTNLLALNATIEAARAGNSGRGFAVVASEVKTLAAQSRRSASEIGGVLQTVSGDVDHAVHSITTVADALGEIGKISQAVTDAMDRHESVASDVARHAATAAEGTHSVNIKIADLAVNTEKAGHLSQDVKAAVTELGDQSRLLEKAAQDFLKLMQAK